MTDKKTIYLTGENLTIEDVIEVAENGCLVDYPEDVKEKIKTSRQGLYKQLQEHPEIKIYGTNVLHGDMKDMSVPLDMIQEYQVKYMKVHNCATGKPLSIPVVRAMMVIRLNSFAKNLSCMRLETCQVMIDMLNKGVTPWVLEEGSVGASGDLIPLAMLGAVMIALPQAKAYYKGKLYGVKEEGDAIDGGAAKALQLAGLKPTVLGAKEAMGLTNGSSFICAGAIFQVRDSEILLRTASIASALSVEAIRGEKDAYSQLINDNRPHEGQVLIAKHMRKLVEGSERMSTDSQQINLPGQTNATVRVQDRYSFRSVPQVHGPAHEAIEKMRDVLTIEINSATDNPLFTVDDEGFFKAKSGANFHGQPLATVIDYLKIALTPLGLMSDKRCFSMLNYHLSYGLPANLAYDPASADGGLMITQYAGVARAGECRVLCSPASVMSLSTSANQEDFVSLGSIGVLHLYKIIYNIQVLLGIELLCALRGIQLTNKHLPEKLRKLGKGTTRVFDKLEDVFGPVGPDRYLRTDMEKAIELVTSGTLDDLVKDLLD